MPTPGRVILVAGQGGAGTSSLARSTVDAIRAEVGDVVAVDASGTVEADTDPSVVAWLAGTLGRVWLEAGADPVLPETWCALPDAGLVGAWHRITQARQTAAVVVVDAGSLVRVRDLCALPGALARLLDAAMTPRMAMWRSASGAGGLFESLSDVRAEVVTWLGVLQHADTSVRLVGRPDPAAVDDLLRSSALLSMLGVAVDGIVVNRVPGRDRKDARARALRSGVLAAIAALEEGSDGVRVWRSKESDEGRPQVRPAPKGTTAVTLLSGTAVPATRSRTMTLSSDDDGYLLDVPMRRPARQLARVGVQGDCLVVSFDGVHAWHEIPSLLHRCAPVGAVRTSTGITIRWSPDADVWPRVPADAPDTEEG